MLPITSSKAARKARLRAERAESAAAVTTAVTTAYACLDSGADGHYVAETDRQVLNLPILRHSTKQVAVANGSVEQGKHRIRLPLPGLPNHAAEAASPISRTL